MKEVKQGEIYWANLNPIKGHEQSGLRPVLIIQNDLLNQNLNTVIIVPLTTNLQAKGFLTTFFLPKHLSKLTHSSVALLFQLRTIDKTRLTKKLSRLPEKSIKQIKTQLQLCF